MGQPLDYHGTTSPMLFRAEKQGSRGIGVLSLALALPGMRNCPSGPSLHQHFLLTSFCRSSLARVRSSFVVRLHSCCVLPKSPLVASGS